MKFAWWRRAVNRIEGRSKAVLLQHCDQKWLFGISYAHQTCARLVWMCVSGSRVCCESFHSNVWLSNSWNFEKSRFSRIWLSIFSQFIAILMLSIQKVTQKCLSFNQILIVENSRISFSIAPLIFSSELSFSTSNFPPELSFPPLNNVLSKSHSGSHLSVNFLS